jgi:hypothetical protein
LIAKESDEQPDFSRMHTTTLISPTVRIFALAFFVYLTAHAANGQTIRYDTRAAYNAAVAGNTIIDFNSVSDGSGTMYPAGLTLSGTTFSGMNGATAEFSTRP